MRRTISFLLSLASSTLALAEPPPQPVSPSHGIPAPSPDAMYLFTASAPHDLLSVPAPSTEPRVAPPTVLVKKKIVSQGDKIQNFGDMLEKAGVLMPKGAFACFDPKRHKVYSYNTIESNKLVRSILRRIGPSPRFNLETKISLIKAPLGENGLEPSPRNYQLVDTFETHSLSGETTCVNRQIKQEGITNALIESTKGEEPYIVVSDIQLSYRNHQYTSKIHLTLITRRAPHFQLVNYDPNTKLGTFIKVQTSVVSNDH